MKNSIDLFGSSKKTLVMSSKEISDITGKRHSDVLRDCRNLNTSYINLNVSKIAFVENQGNGAITYVEAFLDKMQTFDLLTGYNTELRIKVNRRWAELEYQEQTKIKLPQTFAEALQLAADQAKQLELQAPKVQFADNIIKSDINISMANMAKLIGIGRNKLFEMLRNDKVLMSNGNYRNTPYQKHIDSGHFVVTETGLDRGKGLFLITLITPKGQQYLTNKYGK